MTDCVHTTSLNECNFNFRIRFDCGRWCIEPKNCTQLHFLC